MNRLLLVRLLLLTCLIGVAMLNVSAPAMEQATLPAQKITEGRAQSIIVTPNYDLQISVWLEKPNYMIGENVRIFFNVNKECYVYIFNTDANGVTRQIFPNFFDRDNHVRPGTYSLPDRNYNLEVTGPIGREYIRALAVRERHRSLDEFSRFSEREPYPLMPGGVDAFRQKMQMQEPEPQMQGKPAPRPGQPGQMAIVPGPITPKPAPRELSESYTSFYVRARWVGNDDNNYNPRRTEKIRFRSNPDDAEIYIDGEYYGKTSKTIRLSHGPHKIRMRKRGYHDWVRSIYVDRNSPESITATLTRSRSNIWREYRKDWDIEFRVRLGEEPFSGNPPRPGELREESGSFNRMEAPNLQQAPGTKKPEN